MNVAKLQVCVPRFYYRYRFRLLRLWARDLELRLLLFPHLQGSGPELLGLAEISRLLFWQFLRKRFYSLRRMLTRANCRKGYSPAAESLRYSPKSYQAPPA